LQRIKSVIYALVAALLLAGLLASPALARERIYLDPDEGEVGDWIDITGENFSPSDYVAPVYSYVDIYFSSQEADEGDDIDSEVDIYELVKSSQEIDDSGDLDARFRVPSRLTDGDDTEDVKGGTYYVYVTYEGRDRIEAVADFTVIAAEISLSPTKGTVGTKVKITGTDFAHSEDITVKYDAASQDIHSGDTSTDSHGEFTSYIIIPPSYAGEHTIKVTDESDNEAEATFTVEPKMTLSTQKGAPGDRFIINGEGFAEDSDFTVKFGGSILATNATNFRGGFEVYLDVPVKPSGSYQIEVEDEDGNKETAQFTIESNIALSKTTGNVGSEITISGSGFTPNATVTITYTSTPEVLATTTADSNGKFSATVTIPKSTHGKHTITASDGTNSVSTTFTMESTKPKIPQPLLPYDGSKVDRPASFDWEDVTDPSGVTYSLQIATDEDFSDIVLEKTGIKTSGYTLTKEEKLESTKKDAPYYWRIQAVDGASNESGWTAPGTFYTGFAFDFSGWPMWLAIGLGGLLLIVLVFFIGMRQGRIAGSY